MKWLVIVIFMNLNQGVYVFTEPTFETREQCIASITDPQQIPTYMKKLTEEYYPEPFRVRAVNCMTEDEFRSIIEKYKQDEKVNYI